MNIPDFVIDINGYIGTPDTILPYTMAYYIKHGYKKRQLNIKLINELTNKLHIVTEDD